MSVLQLIGILLLGSVATVFIDKAIEMQYKNVPQRLIHTVSLMSWGALWSHAALYS